MPTTPTEWLWHVAERADATIQYEIGRCYTEGRGVEVDETVAFRWYLKASFRNLPDVEYTLAKCFLTGRGVQQNDSDGFLYMLSAAKKGHPEAIIETEMNYRLGRYVEKDDEEADEWLAKCAAQEAISPTITGASTMTIDDWLRIAMERANPDIQAEYALSVLEEGGADAHEQAFGWFHIAAVRQCSRAAYYVGKSFADGLGVDHDAAEAVRWFALATDIPEAALEMGKCYESGSGVRQNNTTALEWFCRAAEQGNATAQVRLGLVCEQEAIEWYKMAAEQGNEFAMARTAAPPRCKTEGGTDRRATTVQD